MLRAAIMLAAIAAISVGAGLMAAGARAQGVYLLIAGIAVRLGTRFERWRYRRVEPRPDAPWQATGERFVDPQSGKTIGVYGSRF